VWREGINFEWSLRKEFNMYNKWGQFGKDFEEGVNFERLREERLQKTREAMKKHGLGAIVASRLENGRYITGFRGILIEGTIFRYVVLPLEGEPVLFEMGGDFGRAKESAPWLREKLRTSIPILGTPHTGTPAEVATRAKLSAQWADGIKKVLQEYGVADKEIGFDFLLDVSAVKALEDAHINYVDGQPAMMDARQIKTQDELQLLSIASQIAEAGLSTIEKIIRPGIRECEVWGEANKTVISLGAERLQGICCTGGRTNPYYRYEGTDKIMRPGDLLITDVVLSYMGYHTCVVRTFLCGDKPTKEQKRSYRAAYDAMYRVINSIKPGVMTDKVAENFPETNWENYSLNIAHGLGVHEHETPFIADVYSKNCPTEIKANMYLAVETYVGEPGSDQGVRLEENFLVTEKGNQMFSRYQFDERML
jgi:Xaa-Pro aminopeptidase